MEYTCNGNLPFLSFQLSFYLLCVSLPRHVHQETAPGSGAHSKCKLLNLKKNFFLIIATEKKRIE